MFGFICGETFQLGAGAIGASALPNFSIRQSYNRASITIKAWPAFAMVFRPGNYV